MGIGATELYGYAKLTVRTVTVAANQARTLEAVHAIKNDDASILAKGRLVQYTDPDLGMIFYGKVSRRRRAKRPGEGVTYICVDNYRQLTKTAATLQQGGSKTGKLAFSTGSDAAAVIAQVTAAVAGYFPGGIAISAGGVIPAMDKGGQSVGTWLDDLLKYTAGGIAYVDPHGGSPRLVIREYEDAQAVYLTEGMYEVKNQGTGELLISEGDLEDSLDERVKLFTVEGTGRFKRHTEEYIPTRWPADGGDEFRWYLDTVIGGPSPQILTRYINADGTCADGVRMKLQLGGENGHVVVIDDPPFVNGGPGGSYFWFRIQNRTPASAGNQYTQTWAWFDYTTYEGPLSLTVEGADPLLEGELEEVHDEFFKYDDDARDIHIDHSEDMRELAQEVYDGMGDGPTQSGNVSVLIKGVNGALALGSPVANQDNRRVRQIVYQVSERLISLDLSDQPIRERIRVAQQLSRERTLPGNDWYQNRVHANLGCFSNWSAVLKGNGQPGEGVTIGGGGGGGDNFPGQQGGGGPAASFYCTNGECEQRLNPNGPYATRAECEANCGMVSFDCVDDCSCLQRDDALGAFPTKAACDDACGTDCGDTETVDPSEVPPEPTVPPPQKPPDPPPLPPGAGKTYDCAPSAVGALTTTPWGTVKGAECAGLREIEPVDSILPQTAEYLADVTVVCNYDGTVTVTKTFANALESLVISKVGIRFVGEILE